MFLPVFSFTMARSKHVLLALLGIGVLCPFLFGGAFAVVKGLALTVSLAANEKHCGRSCALPAMAGIFAAMLFIWGAFALLVR